jgi:hypothetical protein
MGCEVEPVTRGTTRSSGAAPSAEWMRTRVVPWADDPGYREHATDPSFSYMKNHWVELRKDGNTCYGQIQDAGPAVYDDAAHVFGTGDLRPVNERYNGAGLSRTRRRR